MMKAHACANQLDIFVYGGGECDYGSTEYFDGSGSGDDCDCEFGACVEDDDDYICVCDFQCEEKETDRICGSDGKTYRNMCELKKEQCKIEKVITVMKNEPCDDISEEFDKDECDCYWLGT